MTEKSSKTEERFGGSEPLLSCDREGRSLSKVQQGALATLMVHLSVIDGAVPPQQVSCVRGMLNAQCGVAAEDLSAIIDGAAEEVRSPGAFDTSVVILREAYSHAQKLHLLSFLWKLVISDGKLHSKEKRVVTALAIQLGLDEDSIMEAQMMAETGRV